MRQHCLTVCILICMTVVVGGCAATIPTQRHFAEAERHLNTDGSITRAFHAVLYYPDQIQLNTDGYIVGLEKSNKALVQNAGDVHVHAMPDVGLAKEADAVRKLDDPKVFHVSHIIKRVAATNCPIYNIYSDISPARSQFFSPKCQLKPGDEIDAVRKTSIAKGAYVKSWQALSTLQDSLVEQLQVKSGNAQLYTHLVIVTMGWNTPQDEAVRNFNAIMHNFSAAANQGSRARNQADTFRPLLIGVTWPSQWSSAWFDPLIKGVSFHSKAEDADQLGLSWLGVLMHETIPNAVARSGRTNNLPVIAIGHSFGSRAMSTAVCAGPAIYNTPKTAPGQDRPYLVDHLVNYQGAFLSKRLFEEVREYGMHYPKLCTNARSLVLTASAGDTANTRPIWGAYAGEKKAYELECNKAKPSIDCRVADKYGLLGPSTLPGQRIVYVDADALIAENAYDTGGGAHSDIFRPEHGVLLRELTGVTPP